MISSSPQPSNTGATPLLSTQDCIDWLSLTFPSVDNVAYPDWYEKRKVETKPFNGYKKAYKYADGRLEMSHPDRPDMGVHVVMGGECLENLSGVGVTELAFFRDNKASFRRFDVCRDIFNGKLKFAVLRGQIRKGKAITAARSFPTYTASLSEGQTLYIGKKTSDKYARIYDKAYEQGVDRNWIRVEVIFQADMATPAVSAFIAGEDVPSLVKSVIDFPSVGAWNDAFSEAGSARLYVGRKLGNTKEWLLRAAAPALAKQLYLDQQEGFLFDFTGRVKREYDELVRRNS